MEDMENINKSEDLESEINDDGIIKFTNGMLENMMSNPDVGSFLDGDFKPVTRNKVFRFAMKIYKSPAMEAYQKVRQQMVDENEKSIIDHLEKEKDLPEEEKTPAPEKLKTSDIEMRELMAADSEFEIKKLILDKDEVPKGWKVSDMIKLEWLVDFRLE